MPQQEYGQQQLASNDVLAIGSLRNGELLKPLLQGSAFS
jgi:hypothetical protein